MLFFISRIEKLFSEIKKIISFSDVRKYIFDSKHHFLIGLSGTYIRPWAYQKFKTAPHYVNYYRFLHYYHDYYDYAYRSVTYSTDIMVRRYLDITMENLEFLQSKQSISGERGV